MKHKEVLKLCAEFLDGSQRYFQGNEFSAMHIENGKSFHSVSGIMVSLNEYAKGCSLSDREQIQMIFAVNFHTKKIHVIDLKSVFHEKSMITKIWQNEEDVAWEFSENLCKELPENVKALKLTSEELLKQNANYLASLFPENLTQANELQILKFVAKFLLNMEQYFGVLSEIIQKEDRAIVDLEHVIELTTFNASQGYQLAKQIKMHRQLRRKAKDQLLVLQNLLQMNQINEACNNALKTLNSFETREYHPRELRDCVIINENGENKMGSDAIYDNQRSDASCNVDSSTKRIQS